MKTTEENNRMIAEFMGLTESSIPNKYWTEKNSEGITSGEMVEPKYHSSWDWLVPVASKLYLESVGIEPFRISHIFHNFEVAVRNNEIMVAHKYICDGINILNEQKS